MTANAVDQDTLNARIERIQQGGIDILLTDIRMTIAANQLRTSSASTGAVAEDVGYQSEAAFQRAFKLHMGVTPAQYRRQMRETMSADPG